MRAPQLLVFEAVGLQTILSVDLTDDYQGSVAAVVRREGWPDYVEEDDDFGVVIIGYGSCSGCDAWQSLERDERGRLEHCISVLHDVRWFHGIAELQAFVAGTPDKYDASDHMLHWYGHEPGFPEFQQLVAALKPGDRIDTIFD